MDALRTVPGRTDGARAEAAHCCHCRLGAVDVHVRARAIAQQLAQVAAGRARGARQLVIEADERCADAGAAWCWSPERYLDSMRIMYGALPGDWRMLLADPHRAGVADADWRMEIGSRCMAPGSHRHAA